jgi:hypothetical protein
MYYPGEGHSSMGMWAGIGKDEISSHHKAPWRPPWWLILLIVLFPIPFSPWWLTIICVALFCLMLALLMPDRKKPPVDPRDRPPV